MNAQAQNIISNPVVLRVLGGRQDGADYRLSQALSVTVGHGFQHDIVLRSTTTKGLSLVLELDHALAKVQVISGYAELLGRVIAAGETIQLPYFVPFSVGDVAFAVGDPSSERWHEASSLSQAIETGPQHVEAPVEATTTDAVQQQVSGAITHFTGRAQALATSFNLDKRWPLLAILSAVVIMALLLIQPVSSWLNEEIQGKAAVEQSLAQAGYSKLKVRAKADGNLLVSGLISSDKDLTRLRDLAARKWKNVELDVNTLDGLAAAASSLLSSNNIDAVARPGRGQALVIESEYLPLDRQDELSVMIRKEIPLITNVSFKINEARGDKDLQYFFSDPIYGLAVYVEGEPGWAYIRTANGTKWYQGSKLPTGHNLISMGDGQIQFERNGRIEVLPMSDSADAQDEQTVEEAVKY